VRATVLTDPPSGRTIRTSRLLDVRPMIPDDD
jgi:hypothetical protein